MKKRNLTTIFLLFVCSLIYGQKVINPGNPKDLLPIETPFKYNKEKIVYKETSTGQELNGKFIIEIVKKGTLETVVLKSLFCDVGIVPDIKIGSNEEVQMYPCAPAGWIFDIGNILNKVSTIKDSVKIITYYFKHHTMYEKEKLYLENKDIGTGQIIENEGIVQLRGFRVRAGKEIDNFKYFCFTPGYIHQTSSDSQIPTSTIIITNHTAPNGYKVSSQAFIETNPSGTYTFQNEKIATLPNQIDLKIDFVLDKVVPVEYKAVRIGEYYWMNSNFNAPLQYVQAWGGGVAMPTKAQIDNIHKDYLMFNYANSSNATYWDLIKANLPAGQKTDAKALEEFHKYYGVYYTVDWLGMHRHKAKVYEKQNGSWALTHQDIFTIKDGEAHVKYRTWDFPDATDFIQLVAMCGHGTMPEVRQYLSFKRNEVPIAVEGGGSGGWYNVGSASFTKYPADTYKASNQNKYGFNMVGSGIRFGKTRTEPVIINADGKTYTIRNTNFTDMLGLHQAAYFALINKELDNPTGSKTQNPLNWTYEVAVIGDHPNVEYREGKNAADIDMRPSRWCKQIPDKDLGYRLYINQQLTAESSGYSFLTHIGTGKTGEYIDRMRSGEEVLLEKVRNGTLSADNIKIIKITTDADGDVCLYKNNGECVGTRVPPGYYELPKGYLRGFYVQYMIDNPDSGKSVADIVRIAIKDNNPSLWIGKKAQNMVRNAQKEVAAIEDQADEAAAINIYPNPVKDLLFIDSPESIESVQIFNIQGKLVFSGKGIDKSIDVSDLSNGIYIVKINTAQISKTFRIVKE